MTATFLHLTGLEIKDIYRDVCVRQSWLWSDFAYMVNSYISYHTRLVNRYPDILIRISRYLLFKLISGYEICQTIGIGIGRYTYIAH